MKLQRYMASFMMLGVISPAQAAVDVNISGQLALPTVSPQITPSRCVLMLRELMDDGVAHDPLHSYAIAFKADGRFAQTVQPREYTMEISCNTFKRLDRVVYKFRETLDARTLQGKMSLGVWQPTQPATGSYKTFHLFGHGGSYELYSLN